MTEPAPTHLSVAQCAEIADVCNAARKHELISTFIRNNTHPEYVRRLLAKPAPCAAQINAEQLDMQALESAHVEQFCFASLSGEAEITR